MFDEGRPPAWPDGHRLVVCAVRRVCTACGNNNFAFRATCNMRKCGAPKPDGTSAPTAMGGGSGGGYDGPAPKGAGSSVDEGPTPEGSWTCSCGNVNYPFRTECNRRNCGLPRGAEAPASQGQPAIDATGGSITATEGDAVSAADAAVDVTAEAAAAAPAEQEAVEEAAPAAEAAPTPELEAGADA